MEGEAAKQNKKPAAISSYNSFTALASILCCLGCLLTIHSEGAADYSLSLHQEWDPSEQSTQD